ncbi:recombination protein RecR [Candidatus Kuenenbacteria bacterium CG23_combo_of_CG06-09_8_20_14_all_36_9]|uniref:Recombination protein RecR n=1 Tax=Candidatus Kuenenbacteria bacterium CG10_big_fil_rev_8_21_14_0_10_36_11 TaxID=1974618 RepID=A0A2M6WA42_9BACT|nr:MAG: recombination protein RecR [Candidatus Kuenenbacteria bacterium CG23_combo_of_CG06-09_8_20_14_all_36_9]PIT89690.1 MAG: recombination protein RecR [Candidatus Kuenenbacteria bacterium CG10_big_fil_rev_8_21_14_0_10_36_11]
MSLPISIRNLINHFSSLPGLGQKTSERLVFYLLKQDKNFLASFAENLLRIKDNVKNCALCGSLTEQNLCSICNDSRRDHLAICVVAELSDIQSLEKSREFNGVYHVLNGYLSPTEGINPENLRIKELLERINNNRIKEIILALNPTIEGETTVLYLTKLLKRYNIKITKLARGLPQGSDLEYADEVTLANAMKGRTQV